MPIPAPVPGPRGSDATVTAIAVSTVLLAAIAIVGAGPIRSAIGAGTSSVSMPGTGVCVTYAGDAGTLDAAGAADGSVVALVGGAPVLTTISSGTSLPDAAGVADGAPLVVAGGAAAWGAAAGGITAGLDSARPAASSAGALYAATDTAALYIDTGSAWIATRTGLPDTATWAGWSAGSYATSQSATLTESGSLPITVAICWYQVTLPGGTQRVFVTHANSGNSRGWQTATGNPTANRVGWIEYGLNGTSAIEIPTTLTTGWHAVAFSLSVSGGSTLVRYALDGVAGSSTVSGTVIPAQANDLFRIGDGPSTGVPLQSDTGLSHLVVGASAIDATEIAAMTAAPSTGRLVIPSSLTPGVDWRPQHSVVGSRVPTAGTSQRVLTLASPTTTTLVIR